MSLGSRNTKLPPSIDMSGYEMKQILLRWGIKFTEFSKYLGRSHSFFHNCLLPERRVPYRYVLELWKYLGAEESQRALEYLEEFRERVEEHRQKGGFVPRV